MNVVARKAWWSACRLCTLLVSVLSFALYAAVATGAGWALLHLPDLWRLHIEDQTSPAYRAAIVTASGFLTVILCLAFTARAIEMLVDSTRVAHVTIRSRRDNRLLMKDITRD